MLKSEWWRVWYYDLESFLGIVFLLTDSGKSWIEETGWGGRNPYLLDMFCERNLDRYLSSLDERYIAQDVKILDDGSLIFSGSPNMIEQNLFYKRYYGQKEEYKKDMELQERLIRLLDIPDSPIKNKIKEEIC